ncbi:hypothetical protein [Flavobacterium solisilvae]|uniref:Lysine transporter LysE n=1 Tax=Flavobacterium solisilvae TaxID=1852019 RepID=A0ABX1QQF5_9FLAO|nr:hypothetical protein [Flavobacterium solisilvae]NMH24367.1 hypothetical protein [Flavobacterium solisilvae]
MIKIKNIFIGFLISFIGSIPLGYLNVVGYDVFKKFGIKETVFYLLGVISIEFFVIYFTLLFANQLIANQKLLKFIEGFSVVFMFVLAFVFYTSASSETTNPSVLERYVNYSPFVVGLILSSLNFIQVPFWTSWNLYLLNGNFIEISKNKKYFYVFGTVFGTFSGMLVLIFSLNYLTLEFEFFKLFLFQFIIPIVFVILGIFQGFKFYKKYCK